MKKNFKKSKFVILPALATLVLTGVASVTGTVAWFTANRAVSVNTGNFNVQDENSSLAITATAGNGTSVNGTTVNPTGVLTDASFDLTNVWTDIPSDEAGAQPTTFAKVTNADYKTGSTVTSDAGTKDVYYAVDWTYTLTLTTATSKNVDLFFDLSSAFSGNVDNDVSDGFRIAFVAGGENIVWGKDSTATHVSSENKADATFATYVTTNTGYVKRNDEAEGATNASEYLGTFTSTVTSITIKCTAWYEGTDSAVVSGKSATALNANIKFYVRTAKAAAGE